MILLLLLQSFTAVNAANAQICTPLACTRTTALINSNIPPARNPPYACRGAEVTFFCKVVNGASLQWASEPDICPNVPISYTSVDSEGEMRVRGGGTYRSNLTSIMRRPPFSNFTSSLTFDTNGSVDSVMIQCGDQLSSCTSTQDQSTLNITDAPVITPGLLSVTAMAACPNASISISVLFDQLQSSIGLKYELSISSSVGCQLERCPMMLNSTDLTFTLRDDVIYTVTLIVSNDCGSASTMVTIQPDVCGTAGTPVTTPPPPPGGPGPTSDPIGGIVGAIFGGIAGGVVLMLMIMSCICLCINYECFCQEKRCVCLKRKRNNVATDSGLVQGGLENQRLETKISNLEGEKWKLEEENRNLKEEKRKLEDGKRTLAAKNRNLEEEKWKLGEENRNLKDEKWKLGEDLGVAREQLIEEQRKWEEEKNALIKDLSSKQDLINTLKGELRRLRDNERQGRVREEVIHISEEEVFIGKGTDRNVTLETSYGQYTQREKLTCWSHETGINMMFQDEGMKCQVRCAFAVHDQKVTLRVHNE